MEQPATLAQDVLDAVAIVDGRHGLPGNRGRRRVANLGDVAADDVHREVDVAAAVLEATELARERRERLREIAASCRETFDEQESGQDAVPFGQVEGEGIAAALLAARDRLAAIHELGHVLKTDSGLDERGPERARDAVDLEGSRERFRDAAPFAPVSKDVQQEQREDLVRGDKAALRIEHSQPVGVAVLGDGQIEASAAHALGCGGEVRADRLGVHAAEERVALGPKRRDAKATRAARKDLRDQRASGSVHRVGKDGELRRADRRDVHQGREPLAVGGLQIHHLDATGARGARQRLVGLGGDRLVVLRRGASAEVSLDLEPVVPTGVVAGRDRDATLESEAAHVEGDRRRRNRLVREEDIDARLGEDLGRRPREFRGEESRVVPDHDAAAIAGARIQADEARRGGGDAPDLGESAVVGDDAAPAVGAEANRQRAAPVPEASRNAASFASS